MSDGPAVETIRTAWLNAGDYPLSIAAGALALGVTLYAVRRGWALLRALVA